MKKLLSTMVAGCLCFSGTCGTIAPVTSSYALTITASVIGVNIQNNKNVIALDEQIQLVLEWSTGAKRDVIYTSSDENVLTVDSNGLVTGVAEGTAEISVTMPENEKINKKITISVSEDVEPSHIYNTSELPLGSKLKKYDTLHYDKKNVGMGANIVNDKGSYDLAHISEKDYVLPFDAEVVGNVGLYMYLAPDIEGVNYIDGRTLKVGDVIDRNSHLLCYDYIVNELWLPVFLPKYYTEYIGDGEIRLKAIDHEKKTITLEAVPVEDNKVSIINGKVVVDEIHYSSRADIISSSGAITNNNELSAYISDNLATKEIPEFAQKYDEAFFEENVLFLIPHTQNQGGFPFEFDSIRKKGDGIFVEQYTKLNPYGMSFVQVMSSYMIQVAIPKSDYNNEAVSFQYIKSCTGDANNDGKCTVADAVTLQNYLLNPKETFPAHWRSVDFCNDGVIDVFDLIEMRKILLDDSLLRPF